MATVIGRGNRKSGMVVVMLDGTTYTIEPIGNGVYVSSNNKTGKMNIRRLGDGQDNPDSQGEKAMGSGAGECEVD